ncbi:MAG: hypothetical protein HYY42_07055, partial [Chloroflexi bacterium]|nr:hypothetical protein [Chloroflexota bacterium]
MFGITKLATVAVAVVFGLAVTGAAARAAFQPPAETAIVSATDTGVAASPQAEREDGGGLRAILEKLAQKGAITQAQADAILAALKEAAQEKKKDRDGGREAAEIVKRVFGNMMRLSVEYVGLPQQAVAGQLKAGKSLGEIANDQPGKSREGLIAYLEAKITAQLDKAVADGKITQARADEVKSHLSERVTRFVDHKYERKPAPAKQRKPTT